MDDHVGAQRRLRALLSLLAVWDLVIGVYAVLFPHHFQDFIRFEVRPEPLFIRGVGVYWLFAAYFQFLGARDPKRFVVAVQLSIVFRLTAAAIDLAEVLLLLPKPFYFFHYLLLFFVVMNCIIAAITARLLRRMGLKWIEL